MTKLNMYKLTHKAHSNHSAYNSDVARDIIQNYIKDATENTLIVLHGPQASGKSSISQLVTTYMPAKDYKIERLEQVRKIHKVAELHEDKGLVIVVPDKTDLQSINVCFHILDDLHGDKPVIVLLELLTK